MTRLGLLYSLVAARLTAALYLLGRATAELEEERRGRRREVAALEAEQRRLDLAHVEELADVARELGVQERVYAVLRGKLDAERAGRLAAEARLIRWRDSLGQAYAIGQWAVLPVVRAILDAEEGL